MFFKNEQIFSIHLRIKNYFKKCNLSKVLNKKVYKQKMFSSFTKSLALKSCLEVYLRRFSSSTSHASLIELGKKALIYSENEGYVMKSPYGPISVPKLTIDQYIWKNISKWQSHIAIACGVTGRKYTYAKLRDHCAALAIRLRNEMRFNKNDIVAICLPNVPGLFLHDFLIE